MTNMFTSYDKKENNIVLLFITDVAPYNNILCIRWKR